MHFREVVMKMKSFALAVILGCSALGAIGCGGSAASIPARAMPAGASFSGLWRSNFGDMKLTQKPDGYTRGDFDFKTGGSVEGRVEGGVFVFSWVQYGDFQVGRREVSGKAYLVISDDGLSARGKWGYGDNYEGGGLWTAEKATEIYR